MNRNRIAAVQMASGPNVNANLLEAARLIGQAVDDGAGLVALPENFAIMGMSEHDKVKVRESEGEGPIQDFLSQQALKHGIWLIGGTVPMEVDDANKIQAACLLYNDKGERVARYNKMHLFDVSLEDGSENYTESETIESGDDVMVVDTPFGRLGMAICYDLRFPEMFRTMLDEGVELIVLPSAFTSITGRAHWEVLVRARAIENLCYVLAPDQGGFHVNGRETHGDSMIVDPWGQVLDRLPRGSGVVIADVDHERLASIRRSLPAIEHRRLGCRWDA
ncbi:carbon-nitrogen hydrolase family protein [Pseudomonadota bacterium]